MRPPVFGISRTPLAPLRSRDMRTAPLGVEIGSLAPPGMFMCRCNGEWLSRASWGSLTRGGDVIEWHEVPQDPEELKGIVRAGITLAAAYYFGPIVGAFTAVATNVLLAPSTPEIGQPQALRSPTDTGTSFAGSLSGNTAKLDEPIWKVCGRKEITPPFACKPYLEYLPRADDGDSDYDPELDRDQFIFALYAVGIDNHDVDPADFVSKFAKIGNTPITRFADVVLARYLPPGEQPSVADYNGMELSVLANVSTADEVSGQILETGRYVGGFAACAAQRVARYIGIDVSAVRGLGDGVDPLTVEWQVEVRPINDFGQVLGAWEVLAEESRTAYTATPQRWTNKYDLDETSGPGAGRYEVRVVRTDIQDTTPGALHELAWLGLRAYLEEPVPLNEHTAHFELIMRSSSQLSTAASRDLRLITKGMCRTLDTDLEFGDEIHTRNPAWWLLDLCTSSTWGCNKPLSRIDAQSFYDLAQTCEARQDRFDYVFDASMSAWDAMQLIARSCRSRVFRRNGVISVARDELAEIPVTAFTPRNCMPGMTITETLRTRKSPDGVIAEYQDYRTNEWTQIECPMPGVSPTDMERPIRMRFPGITGPTHAEREGLYEAASMLYRSRTVGWTTEMQGLLPAYMSPVDFLPDVEGYGSSGDVQAWDEDALTMTLTEKPDWSQAPLFLTLIRPADGTCHDPIEVEPGDTDFEVVLPEAPDFEIITDDGDRERPKYLIGRKELVKVAAIADGGKEGDAQLYDLRGVIDDERVHLVDVELLPESGEEQDEPLDPADAGGGGADAIANLSNHTVLSFGIDDGGGGSLTNIFAKIAFGNDGILRGTRGNAALPGGFTTEFANEWILGGEIDPLVAAQFEVMFSVINTVDDGGTGVVSGDTLNTWHGLGTERTAVFTIADGYANLSELNDARVTIYCQVRVISTGIVQAEKPIELRLRRLS